MVPGENACDFWYHGKQTKAGNPREVLWDGGRDIPGCCPEGVVYYNPPPRDGISVPASNSRYTLAPLNR